jgi:hypothetical protein
VGDQESGKWVPLKPAEKKEKKDIAVVIVQTSRGFIEHEKGRPEF